MKADGSVVISIVVISRVGKVEFKVRVPSLSTCSSHFVIIEAASADMEHWPNSNVKGYVLTHVATGSGAARCRLLKPLRAVAGVLDTLPIDWAAVQEGKGMWRTAIPSEVIKWIRSLEWM